LISTHKGRIFGVVPLAAGMPNSFCLGAENGLVTLLYGKVKYGYRPFPQSDRDLSHSDANRH
jgi:hypothetical protein